jgi:hypothetical protein
MRKINKKIRGKKNISMIRSAIAYAITTLMVETNEIEDTKQSKLDTYNRIMAEEGDTNNLIQMYEYVVLIKASQTNGEMFTD